MRRLSELNIGTKAKVIRIEGVPMIKRRLLDMGLVPQSEIFIEKRAPLGDPIDVVVKNYHLSLRKDEASAVVVEVIK